MLFIHALISLHSAVCRALASAILDFPSFFTPMELHEKVNHLYDWGTVAERTERVYKRCIELAQDECKLSAEPPCPIRPSAMPFASPKSSLRFLRRLSRYWPMGLVSGPIFCIFVILDWLVFVALEFFQPSAGIEVVNFD